MKNTDTITYEDKRTFVGEQDNGRRMFICEPDKAAECSKCGHKVWKTFYVNGDAFGKCCLAAKFGHAARDAEILAKLQAGYDLGYRLAEAGRPEGHIWMLAKRAGFYGVQLGIGASKYGNHFYPRPK